MEEFKMQTNQKQDKKLIMLGLLIALVYWALDTINLLKLNTELDYTQALVTPGLIPIIIRLIVVLSVLGFSIYASGLIDRTNNEKLILNEQIEAKSHCIATAGTPIVVLNDSLRIIEVNKATARLTGLNAEDILMSSGVSTLFYKNDHEAIEKALQSKQSEPSLGVFKVRNKLGKNCWANVTTAVEYDRDKVARIYLLLNDVTNLMELRAAVATEANGNDAEETQTNLEQIQKEKTELELELKKLQQSHTALQAEAERLEKVLRLTEVDLQSVREINKKLRQENQDLISKQQEIDEDLQSTPVQVSQPEVAASIDFDRFEVDMLLKELEAKRDQTSTILNNIEDGIVITDLYTRITMMNPAAEDILGVRLSQVLERPIHFLLQEPSLTDQLQKTLHQSLQNNRFELRTESLNNNQPLHLDVKAIAIKNRYLQEDGVLLIFRKQKD